MGTTTERDPRTDPRPGDVLADGAFVYEVQGIDREDGRVRYIVHDVRSMSVEDWRGLRHGCRVVSRGAEGGGP